MMPRSASCGIPVLRQDAVSGDRYPGIGFSTCLFASNHIFTIFLTYSSPFPGMMFEITNREENLSWPLALAEKQHIVPAI